MRFTRLSFLVPVDASDDDTSKDVIDAALESMPALNSILLSAKEVTLEAAQ